MLWFRIRVHANHQDWSRDLSAVHRCGQDMGIGFGAPSGFAKTHDDHVQTGNGPGKSGGPPELSFGSRQFRGHVQLYFGRNAVDRHKDAGHDRAITVENGRDFGARKFLLD